MSDASNCNCGCPTPAVTNVAGTAGESAYATNTAPFVVPAEGFSVDVSLSNMGWLVNGMIVIVDGPYTFKVTAVDYNALTATLQWLNYSGDKPTGATIAIGNKVVIGGIRGPVTVPLPIGSGGTGEVTAADAAVALLSAYTVPVVYGGTGATTKAAAQTALGLGQDAVISTVTGLSQAITASATQVAGSDVTIPAAGSWLVFGNVNITMAGATFAASQTVTVKIRNVTQGVDVSTTTFKTGIMTTATNSDSNVVIPAVNYSGGVANDHLQVLVTISVINSAGTYAIANATLCAVPIRKS